MSDVEMITLERRYPNSQLADITDAYMRGFTFGRATMRTTAHHVRTFIDEYQTVGHDECSECGKTIGPLDRYCWWCGARFEDVGL